jgi:hypothetical protein
MIRKTLLAVFVSVGAFFIFGEAVARFSQPLLHKQSPTYYYRQYMRALTQPDSRLLWQGKTGALAKLENSEGREVKYQLNSEGWRDKEPESVDRLRNALVLGDSFSFGLGVEDSETYPSLLERAFPDMEFWNTSAMGYAPDQYAILLQEHLALRDWDLLVIQLSNNDLSDVERHRWLDHKGMPTKPGVVPTLLAEKIPRWNLENPSELLNLARYFAALLSYSKPSSENLGEALDRLLFSLSASIERAQKEGVPVLLLQASDWGENVYGEEWSERYKKDVRGLAKALGVKMLEPHSQFTSEEFLPFPDLHWRLGAHARVAMQLTDAIKKLK